MMATVPGNMVLNAMGYGTTTVHCVEVNHGINIIADEATARMHRALYVTKRTSGSFTISCVFSSWALWSAFSAWLQEYGRRRSHPDTVVREMRVYMPARKFDKYGVPVARSAAIPFGDKLGTVVYRTNLEFVGTRDVLDDASPAISRFVGPTGDKAAPYFYPGGTQLGAGEKGEDWLYNLDRSIDPQGNLGSIIQSGPKEPNIPSKVIAVPGGGRVF